MLGWVQKEDEISGSVPIITICRWRVRDVQWVCGSVEDCAAVDDGDDDDEGRTARAFQSVTGTTAAWRWIVAVALKRQTAAAHTASRSMAVVDLNHGCCCCCWCVRRLHGGSIRRRAAAVRRTMKTCRRARLNLRWDELDADGFRRQLAVLSRTTYAFAFRCWGSLITVEDRMLQQHAVSITLCDSLAGHALPLDVFPNLFTVPLSLTWDCLLNQYIVTYLLRRDCTALWQLGQLYKSQQFVKVVITSANTAEVMWSFCHSFRHYVIL